MTGASLSSLVAKADPAADAALKADPAATEAKIQVMVDHANKGEHYDQLIAAGNESGNQGVVIGQGQDSHAFLERTRNQYRRRQGAIGGRAMARIA